MDLINNLRFTLVLHLNKCQVRVCSFKRPPFIYINSRFIFLKRPSNRPQIARLWLLVDGLVLPWVVHQFSMHFTTKPWTSVARDESFEPRKGPTFFPPPPGFPRIHIKNNTYPPKNRPQFPTKTQRWTDLRIPFTNFNERYVMMKIGIKGVSVFFSCHWSPVYLRNLYQFQLTLLEMVT